MAPAQVASVRIEIAAVEIDALVKRGYIDPKNRDDPAAIGEAATEFISDALFGITIDRLEALSQSELLAPSASRSPGALDKRARSHRCVPCS